MPITTTSTTTNTMITVNYARAATPRQVTSTWCRAINTNVSGGVMTSSRWMNKDGRIQLNLCAKLRKRPISWAPPPNPLLFYIIKILHHTLRYSNLKIILIWKTQHCIINTIGDRLNNAECKLGSMATGSRYPGRAAAAARITASYWCWWFFQ